MARPRCNSILTLINDLVINRYYSLDSEDWEKNPRARNTCGQNSNIDTCEAPFLSSINLPSNLPPLVDLAQPGLVLSQHHVLSLFDA